MQGLRILDIIIILLIFFLIYATGVILAPVLTTLGTKLDQYIWSTFSQDLAAFFSTVVNAVFTTVVFEVPINFTLAILTIVAAFFAVRKLRFPRVPGGKNLKIPLLIFLDRFEDGSLYKWRFPYWGFQSQSSPGIQIKDEMLIVSADKNIWLQSVNYENGASIELKDLILEGCTYEIKCLVRGEPGCTMGFKIWIHDGDNGTIKVLSSDVFETPPVEGKAYSAHFTASETKVMRIHLHCLAGNGRFFVTEVSATLVSLSSKELSQKPRK